MNILIGHTYNHYYERYTTWTVLSEQYIYLELNQQLPVSLSPERIKKMTHSKAKATSNGIPHVLLQLS